MALQVDDCKDELTDAVKNWIAMDGLWFQAVEKVYGMDAAITLPEKGGCMHGRLLLTTGLFPSSTSWRSCVGTKTSSLLP